MSKKSQQIKIEKILYAHVESCEEKEGDKYTNYFIHSRTQNGPLVLKFWNMKNREFFPKEGEYLKLQMRDVEKVIQELKDWNSVSLDSLSPRKPYYCDFVVLNEEDVPEEFQGKLKRDRKGQKSCAADLLESASYWNNPKVHEFLLSFIKTHMENFTFVPAAVGHHHNYKHGLFIHSAEVFSNCVGIVNAPMNKFAKDQINTDALYLAAWLHDAGKMDIYRIEDGSPKINSEKEKRIGHVTISNQMFLSEVKEYDFEEDFVDLVSHCILSHHEKREWGAVVEPNCIEAHILCRADFISSRMPD